MIYGTVILVTVSLAVREPTPHLALTNAVRPGAAADPRPSGGHGLVGMRERVESVGGAFVAGSDGDTYRVSVTLPALALPAGPSEAAR